MLGTASGDGFVLLFSYFLRNYMQTKRSRCSRVKLSTPPSKKIQTAEFQEERKLNIQTISPRFRLETSLLHSLGLATN